MLIKVHYFEILIQENVYFINKEKEVGNIICEYFSITLWWNSKICKIVCMIFR